MIASALLLGVGVPAQAETTTLDFDSVAAGTTVSAESGVTFVGGPKTFVPVHVATATPPNALHSTGPAWEAAAPVRAVPTNSKSNSKNRSGR